MNALCLAGNKRLFNNFISVVDLLFSGCPFNGHQVLQHLKVDDFISVVDLLFPGSPFNGRMTHRRLGGP